MDMPGMDMPGMDHDHDMSGAGGGNSFCTGNGGVMYQGFTFVKNVRAACLGVGFWGDARVGGAWRAPHLRKYLPARAEPTRRPRKNAPQAEPGMHGGGTCPLFLFHGAVVNTEGKYAGAIIGTFLLAMAMEVCVYVMSCRRNDMVPGVSFNQSTHRSIYLYVCAHLSLGHPVRAGMAPEAAPRPGQGPLARPAHLSRGAHAYVGRTGMWRHASEQARGPRPYLLPSDLSPCQLQALLFGVHMLLAYLVMLLVMLYEAALFIAVLFGLAAGYFLFELLSAKCVWPCPFIVGGFIVIIISSSSSSGSTNAVST